MSVSGAIDLSEVGPAFVDPVRGAQVAFRAILEAMSRPGRVQTLSTGLLAGPPAPGLGRAATAALLTLLDAQVPLWLSPALRAAGAAHFLRFHCGVSLVDAVTDAHTVVLQASEVEPSLWERLCLGSDEAPQDGATVLIDGARLRAGALRLALRGPGVETVQVLEMGALDDAFWATRRAHEAAYPRGADLLLCDGSSLAALPRTTRVHREG